MMYETGRIASLSIINDGLNGFSIKLNKTKTLKNIGVEYLYTANQGNYTSGLATLLGLKDSHKMEIESYMNNGGNGAWKYWDKPIGTPIFIIDNESTQGGRDYFTLNAIKSFSFFLSGELFKKTFWKSRYTYSKYAYPRNHLQARLNDSDFIPQNSFLIILEKIITKKLRGNFQFGIDKGERTKNTVGISMGVRYMP